MRGEFYAYAAGMMLAAGGVVTGVDGTGAVGVGLGLTSVSLEGPEGLGLSEGSMDSEGEGLGVSFRSPKISVGPESVGVLKFLYSRPSWRGCMIFFHVAAAGFPEARTRSGVS